MAIHDDIFFEKKLLDAVYQFAQRNMQGTWNGGKRMFPVFPHIHQTNVFPIIKLFL